MDNAEFVGAKDRATRLCSIFPCSKRLSVTVGMTVVLSGDREANDKFLGPILQKWNTKTLDGEVHAHPIIPSRGLTLVEFEATPMD